MKKSKLERGFYPIYLKDINRFISNCKSWNYGNKETCKYVSESIIEKLELDYPNLIINDNLSQKLIEITHDINNGKIFNKKELLINFNEFFIESGKLIISDPCYSNFSFFNKVIEVPKGYWSSYVETKNDENFGYRIKKLMIFKSDIQVTEKIKQNLFKTEPFTICSVDSGQLGFFDYDFYQNDESVKNFEKYDFGENYTPNEFGDEWYRYCCKLTLSKKSWGILPNGVVSSSGFGDGNYQIHKLIRQGKIIGIGVRFI